MDKALVIKTGEVLDIKSYYKTMQITIELPEELTKSLKGLDGWKDYLSVANSGDKEDSDHYILSDGLRYAADEVIAGIDNIRDYKLKSLQ